jgi:parallel beta-helix repeat protein
MMSVLKMLEAKHYLLCAVLLLCRFAQAADKLPDLSAGGVVHLPEGTFELSAPVLLNKSLQLSGEGPGVTTIKLPAPGTEAAKAFTDYALSIKTYGHKLVGWVTVSNLTLDGNGNECGAMRWENVVRANCTRLEVTRFGGSALYFVQVWDSTFIDNVYDKCGNAELGRPVVVLADSRPWQNPDGTPYVPATGAGNTNCNNLSFWGCAWDNNAYTSLWLGSRATKNRFLSCKFHGELPTPVPCNHIELHGSFANIVNACNITNGGGIGIVLDNSGNNVVTSNLISGQRGGGIKNAGKGNIIESNEFSDTWEAKNAWNIKP